MSKNRSLSEKVRFECKKILDDNVIHDQANYDVINMFI